MRVPETCRPASNLVRCFLAVSAADMAIQSELASVLEIACTADELSGLRRPPPDFLHLTLAFLGEQPLEKVGVLAEKMASFFEGVASFPIAFTRLASFPDAKSPILAALPELDPALLTLQNTSRALVESEAIVLETRPFRPHVTLARQRKRGAGKGVDDPIVWSRGGLPGDTLREGTLWGKVSAVSLYRSEITPLGSHYSVIQRCELS
ncbi:predicted 2\'-5\' RNA ligase [gamma proteobacterium HdN1]|nr:predicted 2\'-5\' RNA ligase [gamma proteobacterium HdN1]